MRVRIVKTTALLAVLLSGCTSLVGDTRSVPEVIAASEARGDLEAEFQRYGPFTFLGKYRIQHEWIQAHPRVGLQWCHYSWAGETKNKYGQFVPTQAGLDMWEESDVLYQQSFNTRTNVAEKRDMTIYVIGKYRPNYPGGPRYDHEALCSTSYDGIGNLFNLYLKKTTLEKMREEDDRHSKQMRFAKLLEPLKYESIKFSGLSAEKKTELVALGLKGRENDPIPWRTEEIRVPIAVRKICAP